MFRLFFNVVFYDGKKYFFNSTRWLQPLLFVILFVSLFSFGFNQMLQPIQYVPLSLWLSVTFAVVLSTVGYFQQEYESGCLEQMIIGKHDLWIYAIAKSFSYWLITCLPTLLLSPVLALLLGLSLPGALLCSITLLLGSFTLSFAAVLVSALLVSLKQAEILAAILLLPLYLPLITFGAGAVKMFYLQLDYQAILLVLSGITLAALAVCPFLTANVLKEACR